MTLDGDKAGTPRDVTPGDRDATPTSTTFATGDDFTFSPDGKYLVYTATPDQRRGVEHELRHPPRRRRRAASRRC